MSSGDKCRECGTAIPADSPGGFCAQCLLGLGLRAEGGGQKSEARHDETAPPTERPGDRIGRYRLLQEIGHGGCGVVYMAEQEEPVRRKVALKVIKLGMDTRQVVARFEAERQALALMDHPNIAKIYDAGMTEAPVAAGILPAVEPGFQPGGKSVRNPGRLEKSEAIADSAASPSGRMPPSTAGKMPAATVSAGRPYFVMELVGGIKITDYCDHNNLTTHQRLDLFIQVCRAIQHAHQKGIIHRDIKPSNVLVTTHDGTAVPKVIDFGIAKATQGRLTDQTLFTAFEQFIGTPAYMSPEQAQLGGVDVDTRSDIYSLGVLLYELLTGKTPFDAKELLGAGIEAMRRTIREKEPPKPSTRLTHELVSADKVGRVTPCAPSTEVCSPESGAHGVTRPTTTPSTLNSHRLKELIHLVRGDLDWIVMKCLEKDRARRYETANGLARDIERHLTNEPVVARPPTTAYQVRKFIRRNKMRVTSGIVITTVLVLGVIASTSQAIRATHAEREQKRLRQQAETAQANETREREAAQTEAAKSKQVAQFLKDMLNGVGPSVALGRDTTMLQEILDKTAERVGTHFTNQPAIESELQSTLARVYRDLGQYEKMEAMQRKTVALRWKLRGGDHPEVAESLNYLAVALFFQSKLVEAETTVREAVAMYKRLREDQNPDAANSLESLADILWQEGKGGEALNVEREALAMFKQLLGEDHRLVAMSLDNLAAMLSTEGDLVEAETLARQGLAMRRKVVGNASPEVAVSLNCLACILYKQGDFVGAETLHREALAMRRKLYSKDHPLVISSLANLVPVLECRGKLTEAETLAREYLAISEKSSPDDWRIFDARSLLGSSLMGRKKYAEAEPLLVSGYEGLKQIENKVPYHYKSRLKEALQRLVKFDKDTSQADHAAGWKIKLEEFERAQTESRPASPPPSKPAP